MRALPARANGSTGSRPRSRRTSCPRRACARPAAFPGTSVRTAFLCRDKPAMKEVLREAGDPLRAVDRRRSTPTRSCAFVERVGFPVILKPRDAAGASGTYRRVESPSDLARAIDARRRRARALGRDRGVRRGPRGLLRHADRARVGSCTSSSATTSPTCSRRCASAGSRRSSSTTNRVDAPDLRRGASSWAAASSMRSASGPRPRTWSGSSGRRA